MNLPAYPKYKKSGVKWLGDVPESWDVRRLRFSINSNPVKSEVSHLGFDSLVSFIPMEAVGEQGGMSLNQERQFDEVYSGYTYFADGDIVVAKITPCFENGKGAIAEHLKNGVAFGTTEFHVMRPLEHICRQWLFYLSISDAFRSLGASEMLGAGGQKRIPENFIKDFRIGIPLLSEQQKIANFLDWKTGQIDALITKKKLLIEKLKEKRIALVTHAVTKGLDPNAKMKDSGIPWLGEVPEHWEGRRLKFFAKRVFTGTTPPSAESHYYEDPTVNWFTPSDFGDEGTMLSDSERKLNVVAVEDGSVRLFEQSCVLVVSIGATLGRIGMALPPFSCNQQINIIITEKTIKPKFLFYSLLVQKEAMKIISNSTTLGIMNQDKTKQLELSVPDIDEQNKIVSMIESNAKQLDSLMEKNQQLIEKLTEYRTALITAATTGKINVQ